MTDLIQSEMLKLQPPKLHLFPLLLGTQQSEAAASLGLAPQQGPSFHHTHGTCVPAVQSPRPRQSLTAVCSLQPSASLLKLIVFVNVCAGVSLRPFLECCITSQMHKKFHLKIVMRSLGAKVAEKITVQNTIDTRHACSSKEHITHGTLLLSVRH